MNIIFNNAYSVKRQSAINRTRHNLISRLWQFAFLLTVLLTLSLHQNSWAKDDPEQTEKQLKKLEGTISKLQSQIKKDRTKSSKLESELQKSEQQINEVSKSLNRVNQDLKKQQQKLVELQDKQQKLERAKNQQQQALADDIRAAYVQGRQEYIKLLLNQEEPEKLARMLRYYDYFHRSRSERIDNFSTTLNDLKQVSSDIESATLKLSKLSDSLKQERDNLVAAQSNRRQVVSKLNASLKGKDAELKRLKLSESELQAILDAVESTLDDLPPDIGKKNFAQMKGHLPWPVSGKVVNNFGSRRASGNMRWKGMLIKAQNGQQVRAIHHGRVVFSDWLLGKGFLIIIDHGNGYLSLYGHNQTLYKELGDWVNPGDVIATVGESGGQNFPGLYFELREKGKAVNPLRWIAHK